MSRMADSHPSPGTVSKILWHFTGGPTWNAEKQCQNTKRKSDDIAYENLKSIILERKLRVGQYKEVVNVIVPELRRYDTTTHRFNTDRNVHVKLESSPVCCLADIPIIHLSYHASRYGKFAIGFHRSAVLRSGFNPVLYTLPNTRITRSIYEGFSQLKYVDVDNIRWARSDIEGELKGLGFNIDGQLMDIEMGADDVEQSVDDAKASFSNVLAFVKTFNEREFDSVYCEREWRSLKEYKFELNEVAMIVVPKHIGEASYFNRFIDRDASIIKLPRTIPIVPWEDLVEH